MRDNVEKMMERDAKLVEMAERSGTNQLINFSENKLT